MGNSASGDEGAENKPESVKKDQNKKPEPPKPDAVQKSPEKIPKPPDEDEKPLEDEIKTLENTQTEEDIENIPPVKQTRGREPKKKPSTTNPDTGSLHSSCVSIPDLADAVESPDYDPHLPFIDNESGNPLFKKKESLRSVHEDNKDDNEISDKPTRYTRENDIDQISLTNEDIF